MWPRNDGYVTLTSTVYFQSILGTISHFCFRSHVLIKSYASQLCLHRLTWKTWWMMCKACSAKKSETEGLACCTAPQLSYCHGRCTGIRRFHAPHINVATLGLPVSLSQWVFMMLSGCGFAWGGLGGCPVLGAQTVSAMETQQGERTLFLQPWSHQHLFRAQPEQVAISRWYVGKATFLESWKEQGFKRTERRSKRKQKNSHSPPSPLSLPCWKERHQQPKGW